MTTVLGILAIVLIALFVWQGWRAGLLRRVLELAGVVASFFFATSQASGLGAALIGWTGLRGRAELYVGWVALFLLGLLATRLIASLASQAVQLTIIGWVDRLGGAVCGLLIGVLLASVLLHFAARLPGGDARRAAYEQHPVTGAILRVAAGLSGTFRHIDVGEAPREAWDGLQHGAQKAATAAEQAASRAAKRFGPSAAAQEAERATAPAADSTSGDPPPPSPATGRSPAGR